MESLEGLRVLCCTSQMKGESAFAIELKNSGCKVDILQMGTPNYYCPGIDEIDTIAMEISYTHWLVFSSPYGVKAFQKINALKNLLKNGAVNPLIGLIGKKTSMAFESGFTNCFRTETANSFDGLIYKIQQGQKDGIQKVYHITSFESPGLMPLETPDTIKLKQMPLYGIIPVNLNMAQIQDIKDKSYDLIFLSSPSIYEFFKQVSGFSDLLKTVPLATAGIRTSNHITEDGQPVSIIPETPKPAALVAAIKFELKRQQRLNLNRKAFVKQ